ncbi:MAG: exodeoxyribonuclease VII large subunit [Clostridia bacterium]|nr:exodeoxyribonuclease VII large subunit [Clostridia bacterium]
MEQNKPVISVSELNEIVSLLLSENLKDISVRGEISGFKRHTSGHLYFSLKDKDACVDCVMFRTNAWSLAFRPEDGQQVVAVGSPSLYQKNGRFQLYVTEMQQLGDGELYARFIALKSELERAGMFAAERKKPIPFLPRHVGIVTSGSGAALQDIVNIVTRRFPKMRMTLCPVKVQGAGAAEDIAAGIRRMNAETDCDVLIVGRGGGSIEDLWCFNERIVAEAIFESTIPVISAVGHETDFTIADFVADLRAPTPSAAAELTVPEMDKLRDKIADLTARLSGLPEKLLQSRRERLGYLLRSRGFAGLELAAVNERRRLSDMCDAMVAAEQRFIVERNNRLKTAVAMLGTLSPLAVIGRGYAIVTNAEGHTVGNVEQLNTGDEIGVLLRGGSVRAVVAERCTEESHGNATDAL